MIEQATKKRLTDKKIGLLFSGGIDSVILAMILKKLGVDFYCYTAAVDESSVDVLYAKKMMFRLQKNDILAIMDAGAYFISFANNFSFPKPPIVSVFKGNHKILRKRESFNHMIKFDHEWEFQALYNYENRISSQEIYN